MNNKKEASDYERLENITFSIINSHQRHLHIKSLNRATSSLGISSFLMGIVFFQLGKINEVTFFSLLILGLSLYTISQSLTLFYTVQNKTKLKRELNSSNYNDKDLNSLPIEDKEREYAIKTHSVIN